MEVDYAASPQPQFTVMARIVSGVRVGFAGLEFGFPSCPDAHHHGARSHRRAGIRPIGTRPSVSQTVDKYAHQSCGYDTSS